jgi:cytochrome c-type biogenesis protein CcsB
MLNSSIILSYITFIYFFSFLFYFLRMVMGKEILGRAATWIAIVGLVGHTFAIVLRWIESYQLGVGHAPFSNLYESLIFFAWTIAFFHLLVEKKSGNRSIGTFTMPLAFLTMAYASLTPSISDRIQPLVPALQSNWLIAHVITCFLGYAAFAIAFGLSLMYLLKRLDESESKTGFLRLIPSGPVLDELSYQMVIVGFLMLTIGILTGAVWAHTAWGTYWSWDPKETWSLITWLVYAALLHSRTVRGWKGKRLAIFSIIGFGCVLFTYFGVNYLPGLHSYATS